MASTLGAAQMLAELKVGSNLDKVSSTQYPVLLITGSPWHHGCDPVRPMENHKPRAISSGVPLGPALHEMRSMESCSQY